MTADGPPGGDTETADRAPRRLWRLARRFGPLILVLAAVVAAFASGLTKHLSLHELRERREGPEALVHAHPLTSLILYIAAYTASVALSLPAALVLTLSGGLLFGVWIGGFAAALSCTLGATAVFLICRTAIGDALRRRAGPTAARIESAVRRDAFSYIVTLRLIPVMPFWLANLALGFKNDQRDYGIGAQILRHLGISKLRLMTNNPRKRAGLRGYGLEIVENVPLEIKSNEHNEFYLQTKRDKLGHEIMK